MKKKALKKDFYTEIKKSLNRFLSIFFIVAMGVAFFAGIQSSAPDMRATGDYYFDDSNLMDLKVISTLGLTDSDLEAIGEVEGVEAVTGSYMEDVFCGEADAQQVLHIESLPEDMNEVVVEEGSIPEKAGECFLDAAYAQDMGYEPGDTLEVTVSSEEDTTLKRTKFTISGYGYSPCYIAFERGSTTLGTGSVEGFAYILAADFDAEAYSTAYVRVTGAKEAVSYTEEYDDLVQPVFDRLEDIQDVRCEVRYNEIYDEAQQKIDDARQEVEDGKQEVEDAKQELEDGRAEAESELAEAESELIEGETELADGRQEVEDAKQELEDGEAEAASGEQEIADNEATLESARSQIADARAQLGQGESEYQSGLSQYKKQAATAESELSSAQEQMEAARAQLDAGWEEYNSQSALLAATETQLAQAEEELTASQAAYDAGVAALAEGQASCDAQADQLTAAQSEYDAGASQLAAAWEQYNEGAGTLAAAQTEYEKQAAALAEQKAVYQQAIQDVEAMQSAYDAKEQKISELRSSEAAANKKVTEYTNEKASAEKTKGEKETTLSSKQSEYTNQENISKDETKSQDERDAAQKKMMILFGEIGSLNSDIADIENRITELAGQIQEAQDLAASAGNEAATLEGELPGDLAAIEAAKTENEAANTALEQLKPQEELLNQTKAALDEQSQTLADTKTTLDAKDTALAPSKAALDAGWTALAAARSELDAKNGELAAVADQLSQGWSELNAGKAQVETGKTSLAAAKKELESGESELAASQAQVEAGQKQLAAAKKKLSSARQELDLGWAQLNASQNQLSSGESQLADARTQLSDARSQLAEARQQIADAEKEMEENEGKLKDGWEDYEEGKKEAEEEIAEGEQKILDAEQELAEAEQKIEDAQAELDDLKYPKWYVYDRDTLPDNTGFGENAERMSNIARVFPVLFFLVAALISLTTMTRMVEEERTQIGTLKALGYGKKDIASKYLKYAFFATLGGSIFGVLVGEKILPWIIINAYGIMYQHLPKIVIPYNWDYGLMATAAALVCTIGATLSACVRELLAGPAQLMRPPAPKEGKRVWLEYLPFLWKHLGFTWKSTIRNLMRYKKRFLMTVIGIGGCMGLLLVGYGLRDSIMDVAILQFDELQLYDAMVVFDTDASAQKQEDAFAALEGDTRVTTGKRIYMQKQEIAGDTELESRKTWSVYLYVPEDLENLDEFFCFRDRKTGASYELTDEGAVITEKIADELGLSAGDTITIQDEDEGDVTIPIAAVCENYLSHYIYLTSGLYEELYGEAPEYNSVFIECGGDLELTEQVGKEILEQDAVLNVTYTKSLREQLDQMLGALDIVIYVLIISAGMLAFVVLYNLNNININERKRELATIKVLGFYDGEVAAYVYRENILLTIIGAFVGIFVGKFLHAFVITTVEVDACMFGRNIKTMSFVYGTLFTFGFSLIVNLAMYYKLKKIDMVESLKSVE